MLTISGWGHHAPTTLQPLDTIMKYIKVKSADHLKELVSEGHNDYFISFGIARSSKFINEGEDKDFFILNLIDDSEQELNADELFDKSKTNIGEAIEKGAFWCEPE